MATELRLKQLLWDSMGDWDVLYKSWDEADFMKLDPEEVTSTTMKYLKSVTQLEKGLPSNNVVPILRYKVDQMRAIVSYL